MALFEELEITSAVEKTVVMLMERMEKLEEDVSLMRDRVHSLESFREDVTMWFTEIVEHKVIVMSFKHDSGDNWTGKELDSLANDVHAVLGSFWKNDPDITAMVLRLEPWRAACVVRWSRGMPGPALVRALRDVLPFANVTAYDLDGYQAFYRRYMHYKPPNEVYVMTSDVPLPQKKDFVTSK